ncbi:hypothetical protein [Pseudocitrobacter corydidari]|uniref:Type 1 fimbrial protein n=1 Tax=Pseudocitrobacter corydidari TaxID=2891570 RepID=A0ABY3S2Y4_9ENTR|nr:hypothetical protein [Pseudocitrobacter corydidari]UGS40289.1 hypothetical protein G163CM_09840 [Pseudocitrobacter corydidari]
MFYAIFKKIKFQRLIFIPFLFLTAFSLHAELSGTLTIRGAVVDVPCVIETGFNQSHLLCRHNGQRKRYAVATEGVTNTHQESTISEIKTQIINKANNVYLTSISYR